MNELNSYKGTILWSQELESAVNTQIGIELNNFATYQFIAAAFAHCTIGYPEMASHYASEADEEIKHARQLIDYQNMRGGKVLCCSAYCDPNLIADLYSSKEPVLDSYRMALDLEKYTYTKLLDLHKLADGGDPHCADFLEDMLHEQLTAQQSINFKIAQLSRAGSSVAEYIHAVSSKLS